MVRFSFSQASKKRFRKFSTLVVVLILVPIGLSYWQVHQWLALEKCILYQVSSNFTVSVNYPFSGNIKGLICNGRRNKPYLFDTSSFSQSPPSISRMITLITKASVVDPSTSKYVSTGVNLREDFRKLNSGKQEHRPEDVYKYNYAEESLSLSNIFPKRTLETTIETDSSYGFRRNPNKNASSSAFPAAASSRIPLATYFWLVINVGLYGWYLYKKIDSEKVSLNGQLLRDGGDFGRAFSGNLSHFEIWHLGLNAMSLLSLGEALEYDGDSLAMGGSIGLLLWTSSFVVLVAVGVVGLYVIDRRFAMWYSGTTRPFPSMVGFSGVLFAWSVARTLSLSNYQQICPIPLLSSVCFSTYTLAGGFRFSWGPIVQLVFVQILLHKRVSFVGHLSGTIVGFLWHWGVLPPLEISQPCVLYPILWMIGKSVVYRWSGVFEALAGGAEEQETGGGFATTRGSYLGGGEVLGNGASRWTLSRASQEDNDENENKYGQLCLLKGLQKCAYLHVLAMIYACRKDYGFVLINSMVLSELLLVLVYSLFVRSITIGVSNKNDNIHPLACLGVLGRAYVTFAVVSIVTDSMAMGGWWAMLRFWETPIFVTVLLATRLPLWMISMAAICHTLESANELQIQLGGGNASDSVDGGIWTNVLGWTVAEPCLFLGKYLAKTKWNNYSHTLVTTQMVSKQESQGMTPGRSISNVAGKSRLVDRGNTTSRSIV